MKKVCLLDYENISDGDFNKYLSYVSYCRNVITYIFTSKNKNFNLKEWSKKYPKAKLKVVFCNIVNTGKNNLDFQLSATLGEMLTKKPKNRYYIISKDTGYACLSLYYRRKGIKVTIAHPELFIRFALDDMPRRAYKNFIKGEVRYDEL